MKHSFWPSVCLAASISLGVSAQDPILMNVAGTDIPKSEFEYIYKKNNAAAAMDKKKLSEYVDLFVNYKLKVAEAKVQDYDSHESYLAELEKYENQLIVPYLRDEETEHQLLLEAFERKKTSVLASHILVKVEAGEDTVEAWNKINSIYKELKDGKDFAAAAKEYSDCPSKTNGGSLGYVNVFSTVYEFENAAYSTPVGSFSKPFRTEFGYHIVKVFEHKPNYKDRKVAQILVKNTRQNYTQRVDSLYEMARGGADFSKLAAEFSDDRTTAEKGGVLGFVGQGIYPPQFESAVGRLTNVGDVSKTGTAFGVHIIKLLEVTPYTSVDDCKEELENKLKKSSRYIMSNQVYEEKMKDKYGVEVYEDALGIFEKLMNMSETERRSVYNYDAPLYTFQGNTYPQSDFLKFFNSRLGSFESAVKSGKIDLSNRKPNQLSKENFVRKTFDSYIYRKMVAAERDYLMATNVDFRNLETEYSDGLLLFEISSEKVWNKAAADTAGLQRFFAEHKGNYTWKAPKFKGVVVLCQTQKIAGEVEKILNENTLEEAKDSIRNHYNHDGKKEVKITSGLVAKGSNAAVDYKVFNEGEYKNDAYPFVAVRGAVLSAPQSYEDVKGLVTADYQNFLEEEWVKSLRAKYTVKIYQDVLNTIE